MSYSAPAQSGEYMVEDRSSLAEIVPAAGSSSSPSGGLACAIAALAERQQISGPSTNYGGEISGYDNGEGQESENYFPANAASPDSQLAVTGDAGEWADHRSDIGTSYRDSDEFGDAISPTTGPHEDENHCSGIQPVAGSIVPESFEEQMMLAMAVSLAEARARTSTPGLAWH